MIKDKLNVLKLCDDYPFRDTEEPRSIDGNALLGEDGCKWGYPAGTCISVRNDI